MLARAHPSADPWPGRSRALPAGQREGNAGVGTGLGGSGPRHPRWSCNEPRAGDPGATSGLGHNQLWSDEPIDQTTKTTNTGLSKTPTTINVSSAQIKTW